MNLFTIPLRNLRRRPMRTLLLLLVFTLGVASVVALKQVSQVVGHGLEQKLSTYGANILVAPRSETMRVSYAGFSLGELIVDMHYLDEVEATEAIMGIGYSDRISTIAPKLVEMATYSGRTIGVIGVRFERERLMKSYWAFAGSYPQAGNELLAGALVARELGLETGQEITLFGEPFVVSAILRETGADEDRVLHMDLVRLQELTGHMGEASFLEVAALCSDCPIEDIVAQMVDALPDTDITTLRHVVQQRMASVEFVSRLVMGLGVVILLASCSMLGLSMLSSVNERKKEIGILRSLGFARNRIFLVFSLEALFVGVISALLGYFGGIVAGVRIMDVLELQGQGSISASVPELLVTLGAISLLSVLAVLVPAGKAARIEPSQALVAL